MTMKYQTIQRHRTNYEVLKPSTITAEEWNNLDQINNNAFPVGGSKTLVLILKSSTLNKFIEPLQT